MLCVQEATSVNLSRICGILQIHSHVHLVVLVINRIFIRHPGGEVSEPAVDKPQGVNPSRCGPPVLKNENMMSSSFFAFFTFSRV